MELGRKPNPLWEACLAKVEEMQKDGWLMVSQSAAYISDSGPKDLDPERRPRMCIFKAYKPRDPERAVSYVFKIEARYALRFRQSEIEVVVGGPYEDSSDNYWLEQREHDDSGRMWIVTPDYCHYVVRKDRTDSSDLSGHGGRLFVFEFIVPGDHVKFREAGLKVLLADEAIGNPNKGEFLMNTGEVPRLYTRNLWHQGYIPPKHRHLWAPNAEIVPGNPNKNLFISHWKDKTD